MNIELTALEANQIASSFTLRQIRDRIFDEAQKGNFEYLFPMWIKTSDKFFQPMVLFEKEIQQLNNLGFKVSHVSYKNGEILSDERIEHLKAINPGVRINTGYLISWSKADLNK